MEKPHYKQPITADNIETAVEFYLKKYEIRYHSIRNPNKAFERIEKSIKEVLPEIKSMFELEQLLEENIPLLSKSGIHNTSERYSLQSSDVIFRIILNTVFPRHNAIIEKGSYPPSNYKSVWERDAMALLQRKRKQLENKLPTSKK